MNLDKSRMKIDMAKVLGAKFAEMSDATNADQFRQEGARDALKLTAKRVGDLGLHVDKDLEEGVLSASDLKDPKKVEIFIKRFIKRAVGVIDNLATTAEIARTLAAGRQKGLEAAEKVVQNIAESEVRRLEEIERQLKSGELTIEEVESGGHPGLPLKYQREDEEREERLRVEEESSQTEAEEGPIKQTAVSAKPPAKSLKKALPKKKPVAKKKKAAPKE